MWKKSKLCPDYLISPPILFSLIMYCNNMHVMVILGIRDVSLL